jgi:DNA-binding NtrC family response regulator
LTAPDRDAANRRTLGDVMGETSRRLSALEGFAPAASAAPAEPRPAGRPRILFENLDAIGLEELPDVAHELRTLRRILDLNKRLAHAKDEAELYGALLDGALTLAGADRAFLVGPADDGGVTVVRARDAGGDAPAATGEIASPIARRVLAGGGAEAVDDLSREMRGAAVRSVLCAPFQCERRLALWLDNRREQGAFSAADGDLLSAYAEQAALALERIRLLELSRRQRDELLAAAGEQRRLNERLAESLERRTTELRDARADLALVDEEFGRRYPEIVGRGPAMLAVLRQVDRVAETNVPVLIEGESGTGKDLLARAIHAQSTRAAARFVAENCAALPDSLLENELFGHERGAFTGADAASTGLFERADGGTLFLDEVGDMSVNLQKRLLRALQEGEIRRVGGSAVRKVDVRVVTATNRDLLALVKEGRFREDLYYRLAVVKIRVPPLRERREDVPALCDHFLARLGRDGEARRMTPAALEALVRYAWPGNIRQLDNELRRAAALSRGEIELEGLSRDILDPVASLADGAVGATGEVDGRALRSLVEELETRVVRRVLDREGGNISKAARALGLSRLGLRKKLRRYKLPVRVPKA